MSPRPTFRARELLYPSNILSISRLALVPLILRDLAGRDHERRALALTALALLTDVIDGPIARRRHEESELGKVIDPISDKLLLNGTALTLARRGEFPGWVAWLLLARDVAILLGGALIYRRRTRIEASRSLGKISTFSFGAALLLHILEGERASRPVLAVALAALAGSVVQYARVFVGALRRPPPE